MAARGSFAPTAAAISLCALLALAPAPCHAGGGPLGIDHRWNYDNSRIWKRSNQDLLRYGALAADMGLALWESDGSRLRRNAWQSIDSVVLAGLTAEAAKRVFGREPPRVIAAPTRQNPSVRRSVEPARTAASIRSSSSAMRSEAASSAVGRSGCTVPGPHGLRMPPDALLPA